MKDKLMKFCPLTGRECQVYPSHYRQYRDYHGLVAWLYNPWTGRKRDPRDIGSDVQGALMDDSTGRKVKAAPKKVKK